MTIVCILFSITSLTPSMGFTSASSKSDVESVSKHDTKSDFWPLLRLPCFDKDGGWGSILNFKLQTSCQYCHVIFCAIKHMLLCKTRNGGTKRSKTKRNEAKRNKKKRNERVKGRQSVIFSIVLVSADEVAEHISC